MNIEICVDSVHIASVAAAYAGGAARIELCADMHKEGLTPSLWSIEAARTAFKERAGLLVMIRPVAGDFYYTTEVVDLMAQQITEAKNARANGVVFGVLDRHSGGIHINHCSRLVEYAKNLGLETTFHRAIDATNNLTQALSDVIEIGFDRVLSCGIPWGQAGNAMDGIECLQQMHQQIDGRLELVIGGGINHHNAPIIADALRRSHPEKPQHFSFHAYSSVLENGIATEFKVAQLVSLLNR